MGIDRRRGRALATLASLIAMTGLVVTAGAAPLPVAPAQIAPQPDQGTAEDSAGEPVDQPGFFSEYFPFFPDKDLAKPVDDNMVIIYLLSLLPFGGLWGPLVVLPTEGRPPVGGDVIVPYLVPMFTGAGSVLCLWAPTFTVGLIAGLAVATVLGSAFPPCALCAGCGPCASLACLVVPIGLQYWIAPTASINAWGRAYKKAASSSALLPQPELGPTPTPAPDAKKPAPDAKKDTKKKDDKKSGSDDAWVPY